MTDKPAPTYEEVLSGIARLEALKSRSPVTAWQRARGFAVDVLAPFSFAAAVIGLIVAGCAGGVGLAVFLVRVGWRLAVQVVP